MPTKQEIRAAFALFDTNGDGKLSPDELKAIMCKAVPGGTAHTEEEVDALLKQTAQFDAEADRPDGVLLDGTLSMEEIAGAWEATAIEETVKAVTEAPAETATVPSRGWRLQRPRVFSRRRRPERTRKGRWHRPSPRRRHRPPRNQAPS